MSEVLHRTKEDVEEIAQKQGLVAIIPEFDEITLDLDGDAQINDKVLKCLTDNGIEILSDLLTVSKNGNAHVYIKVKTISGVVKAQLLTDKSKGFTFDKDAKDPFEADEDTRVTLKIFQPIVRIALQACLGSDPVREVLSLLRGEAWDCPIALFETPKEAARVLAWRTQVNRSKK